SDTATSPLRASSVRHLAARRCAATQSRKNHSSSITSTTEPLPPITGATFNRFSGGRRELEPLQVMQPMKRNNRDREAFLLKRIKSYFSSPRQLISSFQTRGISMSLCDCSCHFAAQSF